jgi:ribosomal protein S27E
MRTLTPGEWYLRFTCEQCKTKQILFPDISRGRGRIRASYEVDCPACGHRAVYDEEDIERYQHPDNVRKLAL